MKRLLFAALIIAAAVPCFAGDGYDLYPGTTDVSAPTTIPLTAGNLPVAAVSISGHSYRFAIDTSVKCSLILDKQVAQELGLAVTREVPIANAGQTANHGVVRLPILRLGAVEFAAIDAITDDVRSGFKVDGLIGYGLFHDLVATLDFARPELRLAKGTLPKPDGKTVFDLIERDGVPGLVVFAAGRAIVADINTAVPAHLALVPHFASLLGAGDQTLGGALTVGSMTFRKPSVVVSGSLAGCAIGTDALRGQIVSFDPRHLRVEIVPAS